MLFSALIAVPLTKLVQRYREIMHQYGALKQIVRYSGASLEL